MAHHRATFEVTAGVDGSGYDDVSLKLPSSLARHAQLDAVSVDSTLAAGGAPQLTLRELVIDDDGDTQLGDIVYHATSLSATPLSIRAATADADAVARADGARPYLRRKTLRAEIDRAVSGDVFTIEVYYETSGDYRF